jgi:hypothetical protein
VKDATHFFAQPVVRIGPILRDDQEAIEGLPSPADIRRIVVGISQQIANLGGNSSMRAGATSLSASLAGVSATAKGIHIAATVAIRCSFQPYTHPCQPDLVHAASVSIDVCGTTPCSRCFLCHTPPFARSTGLSMEAARPHVAHG